MTDTRMPYHVAAGLVEALQNRGQFPRLAREGYRLAGWQVVEPGSPVGCSLGFQGRDWLPDSFLARKGAVVEAALLNAKRPGHGAFSRVRAVLENKGYRLRIVSPIGEFRAALQRQGYAVTLAGDESETRREIWHRPDDGGVE
jgi:hypothetical protein